MRNKEANATDPGALTFRGRSPCVGLSKSKRDRGEGAQIWRKRIMRARNLKNWLLEQNLFRC